MLKKEITYEDFNGKTVTETFYFHIPKSDFIEMEVNTPGGYISMLERISKEEDNAAIYREFKNLVLKSYGKKADDGKRFDRSPALVEEFLASPAFDALIMEFFTNGSAAAEFASGIVPGGLQGDIAKMKAAQDAQMAEISDSDSEKSLITPENPRYITREEAAMMDQLDLAQGFSTGQYKLKDDLSEQASS